MWELAGNYTATMIGYHAIPVIVDAYMKGFDKIEGKELLEACIRSSVYDDDRYYRIEQNGQRVGSHF